MEIFDFNINCEVKKEFIDDSPIYIIDNFYYEPERVLDLFYTVDSFVHREAEVNSFNQIHFDDRRHIFNSQKIKKVYDFLSELCGQLPRFSDITINTNFTRFKKVDFNDYKNNYWWPHRDSGYNGILYLNKNDSECGTNLYENLNPSEEPPNCPEHFKPWRSKSKYKLLKSIEPKFNRMVLFDGYKYPHGMNICNEMYFDENYRMNQVFFFRRF
jgi:hypothetical protein